MKHFPIDVVSRYNIFGVKKLNSTHHLIKYNNSKRPGLLFFPSTLPLFSDSSGEMKLEDGELLLLSKPAGQDALKSPPHCTAQCVRTGISGLVKTSQIYVLPTLTEPSQDLVVRTRINIWEFYEIVIYKIGHFIKVDFFINCEVGLII